MQPMYGQALADRTSSTETVTNRKAGVFYGSFISSDRSINFTSIRPRARAYAK